MPPFLMRAQHNRMAKSGNIYLIGLMGAGKTTIGRLLAKSLKMPFYDSDKIIEELTGVDIPTIFEFEGEAGFREREQKAIAGLTQLHNIILATGGGAVIREENRRALKDNGFVVYLQCSIDKILERTKRDTQRPLLQTENPRAKLQQLLTEREALYLSCADYIVDSGLLQSKAAVKNILQRYKTLT
ncbi:MAG: shikimate kinase AroK [Methylomicrobium sp.]